MTSKREKWTEQVLSIHRERFALKRRRDRQLAKCKAQFGPDGPGSGPPDPEPPCPQRMRVSDEWGDNLFKSYKSAVNGR